MLKKLLGILILLLCMDVYAAPIRIVAAENFYGQLAEQLGGPYVQVTSILNNPQQDPHLFTTNPETAKAIANANIIVYNGLGYDPWIKNLIPKSKEQRVMVISDLAGKVLGSNPHIWYDPRTMLVYANYLSAQLSQLDTGHQEYYHQQLVLFNKNYQALMEKIQHLQKQYQGVPIIATEPVFNYMAEALGLVMNAQSFQISVMNDSEPSVSDTKDFEDKLRNHQIKALVYNNQVAAPITDRMRQIAQQAKIPVVGVSETEPQGQNYFTWMTNQLNSLDNALRDEGS